MKKHTYDDCGAAKTVRVEDLVATLQAVYEDERDTEMAVNTRQRGKYLRMDGFFMGAMDAYGMPSTEVFSFQDKADGEYYTFKFTEIVRTY